MRLSMQPLIPGLSIDMIVIVAIVDGQRRRDRLLWDRSLLAFAIADA